jgi:caffeoyl-CoA O-methyltransferase
MPPLPVSRLSTFQVFVTFLAVELKYVALNDSLYRYLSECRSDVGDPVLAELRAATDALGDISRMQISGEQGMFLQILTAASGARHAIEVGTFTGYSSLCIARGLPSDGRLICVDASQAFGSELNCGWGRPFLF